MYNFYEFFAGGGMARAGLGEDWQCLFANDFDHKKSRIYRLNWNGGNELVTADVGSLQPQNIPGEAHLAWASFPCQDLSLAGAGAGLKGERSGTFWPFWSLMKSLMCEGRAPKVIVLENVCGALSSHNGKDFTTICKAFESANYRVGALVVDASLFVPQSRPRLFVIGIHPEVGIPEGITACGPSEPWHTKALRAAYDRLPTDTKKIWQWWNPPLPAKRQNTFADIIEDNAKGTSWFSTEATRDLLAMMSDINRAKVNRAMRSGRRMVGGIYKRTRPNVDGTKSQRAEVRFDDISGCLRTPAGGSSRQIILTVEGNSVKARLISPRETARLMGLLDSYTLPDNYNEAYHLTGDGVVVPVVRHLAECILEPILDIARGKNTVAA